MSIKVLTRCRCAEIHTSLHTYLHCAFHHARIEGTGRFALITRCGLTTITQYPTEAEAHAAKTERDSTPCSRVCRGSHEVVQLSPNPAHQQRKSTPESTPAAVNTTALRFSH